MATLLLSWLDLIEFDDKGMWTWTESLGPLMQTGLKWSGDLVRFAPSSDGLKAKMQTTLAK